MKQFLCFILLLGLTINLVVAQDKYDDGEAADTSKDQETAEPKELTKDLTSSGSAPNGGNAGGFIQRAAQDKRPKKENNRLAKNVENLRERVSKGQEVLAGIVESFVGNPTAGDENLDKALANYDEIVEDVEADFTKAKLELGLKLEESLKKANESGDLMMEEVRNLNNQFIDWSQTNRARMTDTIQKGISRFNGFLSMGIERFLEMSEMGKDVLRNAHKRRNEPSDGFFSLFRGGQGQ